MSETLEVLVAKEIDGLIEEIENEVLTEKDYDYLLATAARRIVAMVEVN